MRFSNWNPGKADPEIMSASMDRLQAVGELIAGKARQNVPVKSGMLKASIRVTRLKGDPRRNIRVYAGNRIKGGGGAFYAFFVEYGHGPKKKAHPFLRPALNSSKSEAKSILLNGV